MDIEEYFRRAPFSLKSREKSYYLDKILLELTEHHRKKCNFYQNFLDSSGFKADANTASTEIPFLPVEIFKSLNLSSVDEGEIVGRLTSSGTSGRPVSMIQIDKKTAFRQSKVLKKVLHDVVGSEKRPMIVVDAPNTGKKGANLSARTAGIIGFSQLSSKYIYALDEEYNLDLDVLRSFIEEHNGNEFIIFGFTFLIFSKFLEVLIAEGIRLELGNSLLIHGGGWKKLADRRVNKDAFRQLVYQACSVERVFDYYGMAEQAGSIFFECEHGNKHVSIFSDILIRRASDFSLAKIGEPGIIQTMSVIPTSYPGHSLITADRGVVLGVDNCPCGRPGKYFEVLGRLESAEIRGCSDTYE